MAQALDADVLDTPIGDIVSAWRRYRNLSATELADVAGSPVSKSYISMLEKNRIQSPGRTHLVRIADALGIPVIALITRQGPPHDANSVDDIRWGNDDQIRYLALRQEFSARLLLAEEHLTSARKIMGSLRNEFFSSAESDESSESR